MAKNNTLFDVTSRKFGAVGNIVPLPRAKKNLPTPSRGGFKGEKGNTTNHYNINISFDDLKDFPNLMDYLAGLKEETDRVPDPWKDAV